MSGWTRVAEVRDGASATTPLEGTRASPCEAHQDRFKAGEENATDSRLNWAGNLERLAADLRELYRANPWEHVSDSKDRILSESWLQGLKAL